MNVRAGYHDTGADPEFDAQIQTFFSEDQELLRQLVAKLNQ
jgi:hypothetical protein